MSDRIESVDAWEEHDTLLEEFAAKLKRDAPGGCLFCQIDEMEDE